MARLLLLVSVLFAALTHGAAAQTTKATGPEVYKLILENAKVRVYQANFAPGAKLPARNFPDHLIYMLTDGTLVFDPVGRTGYEMTFKAGEAQWFPALTRAMQNDTDKDIRLLVVEVKEGAPARASKARAKRKKRR